MAIVLILLSYVLGSIPAGVVVSKLFGVDITKVGSGNIGATNVLRTLGPIPAAIVFLFDVFKGGIAIAIARALNMSDVTVALCAVAVVIGHDYSMFLNFKGGKGVATSLGTVLIINPPLGVGMMLIAISVIALTRYVSAGSMVGGVAAVVLAVLMQVPAWQLFTCAGLAALLFWTHRENITRLQAGNERRISFTKREKPEASS